jgi:hypothetical protein
MSLTAQISDNCNMDFAVGDTVYNKLTGEQGTIVRMVETRSYVVSIVQGDKPDRKRESLWIESQITNKRENIPPWLRKQ